MIGAALTACVVLGMVYVMFAGSRMYNVHLPLVDAANVSRVEATLAHLALDEIAAGTHHNETVEELWKHLESAHWHLHAILEGGSDEVWAADHNTSGKGDELAYVPLHDPQLDRSLQRVTARLHALQKMLERDIGGIVTDGMNPGQYQEVEGMFHAYMLSVDRMDLRLHRLLQRKFDAAHTTQVGVIIGTTLLGLLAMLMLFRIEAVRSRTDREKRQAQRRARENEQQLTSVVMHAVGEAIVAIDREGAITTMNRAAQGLLCPEHPEEETRHIADLCLGPCGGGRVNCQEVMNGLEKASGPMPIEAFSTSCKYQEPRTIEGSISPLLDAEGTLTGAVFSFRDVTERKRMEQALIASEARHEQAQRIASLGHWDWNIETGELTWSSEVFRMMGYEPGEIAPSYDLFISIVHPDDRQAVQDAVEEAVKHGTPYHLEHRITAPDGEIRTVLEQGEVNCDPETGKPVHMMGTVYDITERKELEEKLEELAITDGLTGLYNRRHFDTRIWDEFKRAVTYYDLPMSLLLIDLDHFKKVNDTHGHQAGDAFLKAVSALLLRSIRQVDFAARYGGEELALILPQTNGEQARELADRLREKIANMVVEWSGGTVSCTVSIGVADPKALNLPSCEDLIQAADKALYEAKHQGRNRVVLARSDTDTVPIG